MTQRGVYMLRLIIWKDKKRILGMPISFTNYSLGRDRLFVETGLLTRKEEQILLYRMRDISIRISLLQRIFKIGTISLSSSDETAPIIVLKNIRSPKETAQLIHEEIEKMKKDRGMQVLEHLEQSTFVTKN